jgi:hypothetical protein
MEWQNIINLVALFATFSGAIMGWYIIVIFTAQKEFRKEMTQIRVDIPSNYVRKEDVRNMIIDLKSETHEALSEIRDMLKSILLKLDNKADK